MKLFETNLLCTVIVIAHFIMQSVSSERVIFCVNETSKKIKCDLGSVISIGENSLRMCYKDNCGEKQNTHEKSETSQSLIERCHGKQYCTMYASDIETSECSSKVNVLEYTYKCVNLNSEFEDIVSLSKGESKQIGPNKDIHVKSQNYPKDIEGRFVEAMTYICTFTSKEVELRTLDLRLHRISLAKNSHFVIEIDGKTSLSHPKSGNDDFIGEKNCELEQSWQFTKQIKVHYRQCENHNDATKGSMWITMRANSSLDVTCESRKTMVTGGINTCSRSIRKCLEKVNFYAANDRICSCTTSTSGGYSSSDGVSVILIVSIILGVSLVLVSIVCILLYVFIWKRREDRKQGSPKENVHIDTSLTPMHMETQDFDHYTDIDLRPSTENCTDIDQSQPTSSHYTDIDLRPSTENCTDIDQSQPASSHYTDIDLLSSSPLRNNQNDPALPDGNVLYGKVNKTKKNQAGNKEEVKMLDNNGTQGFAEAEEDEMVMQENTDIYS